MWDDKAAAGTLVLLNVTQMSAFAAPPFSMKPHPIACAACNKYVGFEAMLYNTGLGALTCRYMVAYKAPIHQGSWM
jgi:hypothetical protein